jgi:hypothetical protein
MSETFDDLSLEIDREQFVKVARPLFYGYVAMAAFSLVAMPEYAGNMFGLALIPAISMVSASLSKGVKGDWQSFLDVISLLSLLAALLLGTYVSSILAFS